MSDYQRRVEHVCRLDLTGKALRERLLALVRERVAYDAHVFALTDPMTLVATSPHADVPMLPWPRLPELIRWRYLSTVNRWDRMLGSPATSLLMATDDPAQSLMWRHVQRELGIVDTASVAFGDRYGAWGYLELWRTTTPFTAGELAVLTSMAPAVTPGLRTAIARTFLDNADRSLPTDQLFPSGAAVVVLDPDLRVRSQTAGAVLALLQLLPPEEATPPIPAAAYNVGAALVAQEQGVPIGAPWSRVHLGGSRWITARASRLGDDIAVSLEPSTPAERTDLLARASGLSARESEVLDLLVLGLDSREIAGTLVLSDHTVNDHVKAILAKTGARTRQVLISRALGAC